MSIKLETLPFEYEGKTYQLRCNMNVLSDVQDLHDGDLGAALDEKRPLRSVLEFLAAMMNDYADEMGWPERFTARQLGRKLTRPELPEVMRLVVSSLIAEKRSDDTPAEDAEKN